MDWHAQANHYYSGLNRFVNYWETIELLGHYFYDKLPADVVGHKSKEQKKDEIMKLLKGESIVTRCNCIGTIKKCNAFVEPSARTKITGFLHVIADQAKDQQKIEDILFRRDAELGKSLKDIRDDIAHGNISERDFETVARLNNRLDDAQHISKEIILRSIMCAEELYRLINKAKNAQAI